MAEIERIHKISARWAVSPAAEGRSQLISRIHLIDVA
jgi:hypothetical protein